MNDPRDRRPPASPAGTDPARLVARRSLVALPAFLAALFACAPALAQGAVPGQASALDVLIRWSPLLLQGFLFNILISLLAMGLGTALGAVLGLLLLSERRMVRVPAWLVTQFFRNAPWLVLLFFIMFLIPFQIEIAGIVVPLPAWLKAVVGFALPVMANVAEVVRGAVRSIPQTQWEAAEALAFGPRRIMWRIILPQCLRRMLPPWMNIYSLVTMSTVTASIVGVTEMMTLTAEVHTAEGSRPELFAPLYGFTLLCFYLYCYPIGRFTAFLERRLHV